MGSPRLNQGLGILLGLWLSSVLANGPDIEVKLLLSALEAKTKSGSPFVPTAGQPFRIGFAVGTGSENIGISGLQPAAWIRPRTPERKSCKDLWRNYLALGPFAMADISLNGFDLFTFNRDRTLALIDPRFNFASSDLRALLPLASDVGDWQLTLRRDLLVLTLPSKNQVLLIAPVSGQIIRRIAVSGRPTQLALFEGLPWVWVASDQGGMLRALDLGKGRVAREIKVGRGRVRLAQDRLGKRLFAYAEADGQLIRVDVFRRRVIERGQIASQLQGPVYSQLADRLYLADQRRGVLIAVAAGGFASVKTIATGVGVNDVNVSPSGRWLLASVGKKGLISLIDATTQNLTHVLDFQHSFDQVFFSERFAYLRLTDAPKTSLIHLPSLAPGREPKVTEVQVGSRPPESYPTSLAAMDALPDGGGVIVANPADRTLHLIMEDDNQAPKAALKTLTAPALAVKIHDRSLRESQPGIYETTTSIQDPGLYEAILYSPNPPLFQCLTFEVQGADVSRRPGRAARALPFRMISQGHVLDKGKAVTVEFVIRKTVRSDRPVNDVRVMLFHPDTNWRYRGFAHLSASGSYRIQVDFPRPGIYKLAVESARLGLYFGQQTPGTIEVTPLRTSN